MDFVFLSTQAWNEMDGAGRPIHYLARELLSRGERVLFIEFQASRGVALPTGLTLVNFAELGFDERALRRAWCGLDPQIGGEFEQKITHTLDRFETPHARRVVVYADPFVPFVRLFAIWRERHYTVVYDALDDFEAFPELGLYFPSVNAERFLVTHSDLVLAVSTTLVEKLSRWKPRAPIRLLRQGFDPRVFRRPVSPTPPPNLVRGTCTLGFWGQVNHFNLDVALIEEVARARPEWAINLIGPVDRDPALPPVEERLHKLDNVHLLGWVPHDALADYLPWFDVTLVPFPDNAFNRARDPLKVFEYLSGYKPVVAAHAPQLAGMPYVYCTETPQEFLEAIEQARTLSVDRAGVDAYLAHCTWSARLDQLLRWLEATAPARDAPVSEVNAWYADAVLDARLREYIARTERLLDERTAYIHALEQQARAMQQHIGKLERTHPGWWLKRFFTFERLNV